MSTGNGLPTPSLNAPLFPVTLGMMAGIAADRAFAFSIPLCILLVSAGGVVLFARRGPFAVWVVGLILASAGLGAMRHAVESRRLPADHIGRHMPEDPAIAGIAGRIVTRPVIVEPAGRRAYPTPPRTRFVVEVDELTGVSERINVSGRVAVSVKEPMLFLRPGDRVRMRGWLYKPKPPSNPGAYDWAEHNRRAGILARLTCDHAASVTIQDQSGGYWHRWLSAARHRLHGYLLDRSFQASESSAGVISAMVLGQRSAVDRVTNEAFVRTGNAHFLAASGMHVGWLALMGWGMMRIIGVGYRATSIFIALLVLSYLLLAEPRPSILRASIVAVIGCWSVYRNGRPNVLNWLACSALLILLIDPDDLFRPSFQLSFVAVLAVLHLSPLIDTALARMFSRRPMETIAKPTLGWRHAFIAWLLRAIRLAVAVSLAAWIANVPLACYHFEQFAPWGWLGTLLLIIPAFTVTALGYVKVVAGLLWPSSAGWIGPPLSAATRWMVDWVELMAGMPGTLVDVGGPPALWVFVVYAALLVRVYRPHWVPDRRFWIPVVVLLVAWPAIPARWIAREKDTLKVWMLAVGDGTGTVIEMPDGSVYLYDLGTRSGFDAGRVGLDCLAHLGIDRIDAAFVSHANFDHYGGIAALTEKILIRRIFVNDQFALFSEQGDASRSFLTSMRDAGVEVQTVSTLTAFEQPEGVTIEILWPPPADHQQAPEANDASTVLRLTYAGKSVLLTGDIEEWGMAGLMKRGAQADVLALPHHGSVVSNTLAFIESVDPKISIRSSGQADRLTTNGIEALVGGGDYYNTADNGCTTVTIHADGRTAVSCVNPD